MRAYDPALPLKCISAILECEDPIQMAYLLDLLCYHRHSVTTLADVSGMAHSVEIRNPFLDYQFIEFAAALPVRYKTHSPFNIQKNKLILKKALEEILPAELLNAEKLTFGNYLNCKVVLGPKWQSILQEVLLSRHLRETNLFNMEYIAEMLRRYCAGDEQYDQLLWGLLIFELWYELLILQKDLKQVRISR